MLYLALYEDSLINCSAEYLLKRFLIKAIHQCRPLCLGGGDRFRLDTDVLTCHKICGRDRVVVR